MAKKAQVKANKRWTSSIPTEIIETLSHEEIGYSWLIKGRAGVGKTTLALTLLNYFKSYEPVYLSTRVAPHSLFAQFPFLRRRIKTENILDATRTYIPPVGDASGELMRDHLKRTIRFSSVPEFLDIVYNKVNKFENPIIIIDSWDAITRMSKDEPENIETLFTEFIRQTKAKLILIAESDEISFLDYIVDGISTVRDEIVDGRTLRTLEINKIRTVERRQKFYPFTLFNNRFSACLPFNDIKPDLIKPWDIIPDNDDLYSTGNRALDLLYKGGLRQGTFNLLEVESTVSSSAYSSIVIGLIANFIRNERGAIIHTMDGINSDLLDKKRLFLYLETDAISTYMRILMEQLSDRNEIRPYIIQTETDKMNDTFFDVYANLSEITKFQPVVAAISYDTLQFMVDFKTAISDFYKHLKLIRNSNVIELGIINTYRSKSNDSNEMGMSTLTQDMSYAADTHIKIIERHGGIFIYGIKPRTFLYYMRNNYDHGFPQLELTPIV